MTKNKFLQQPTNWKKKKVLQTIKDWGGGGLFKSKTNSTIDSGYM